MNSSVTMSTLDSGAPTNGSLGVSTIDRRHSGRSPMSLGGNLGASTLSMRAKAARKRRVNAQHNSNFRAGFVPVEEDFLQRSGIRGRKRYILYCVVGTLVAITFLNLALNAWLLYLLGMTPTGLPSLEFLTMHGRDFMRVLTQAQISTLAMNGAPIGARYNSSLEMLSEDTSLKVSTSGSSLILDGPNLTLTTKEFCIKTHDSNRWISANLPSLVNQVVFNNLHATSIAASQINGMKNNALYIENYQNATNISGRKISMAANKDINVNAPDILFKTQSSIIFDANDTLFLKSQVPRGKSKRGRARGSVTYKLCVCAGSGRLYAVKAFKGVSCDLGPESAKIC